MPLVVVCGQPSSGKSTIAAKLQQLFASHGAVVHLIDEPSLFIDKNVAYKSERQQRPPPVACIDSPGRAARAPAARSAAGFDEKNARAKLKSQVERTISKKDITIFDSLNNIKVSQAGCAGRWPTERLRCPAG
jgi:protein KTI12